MGNRIGQPIWQFRLGGALQKPAAAGVAKVPGSIFGWENEDDLLFQSKARLEVSGILAGGEAEICSRLQGSCNKSQDQMECCRASSMPAVVTASQILTLACTCGRAETHLFARLIPSNATKPPIPHQASGFRVTWRNGVARAVT